MVCRGAKFLLSVGLLTLPEGWSPQLLREGSKRHISADRQTKPSSSSECTFCAWETTVHTTSTRARLILTSTASHTVPTGILLPLPCFSTLIFKLPGSSENLPQRLHPTLLSSPPPNCDPTHLASELSHLELDQLLQLWR